MGALNRGTDRWFHVRTDHARFAAFQTKAVERHVLREPAAFLSVNMKVDGTEALIKVRGADNWRISSPICQQKGGIE